MNNKPARSIMQQALHVAIPSIAPTVRIPIWDKNVKPLPVNRLSSAIGVKAGSSEIWRAKCFQFLSSWVNNKTPGNGPRGL
jgi:hypothetical protein